MPEARGRLEKGETARLELNEGRITVSVQRGFIGKKMVPLREISLENVSGVELLDGEKAFKGSRLLRLEYMGMDGGGELVFYSAQVDQIDEIHGLINDEIHRREEELRRQMSEYVETRDHQLNMLYQDLEIVDLLFDFAAGLIGEIDWGRLRGTLEGIKQVQREMEALGSSHYRFSLDGFEAGLQRRRVDELKRETVGLLEIALQGVTEASTHPVQWFNSKYHHLFVTTLYLLHNRELSGLTGASDDGMERRLGQQAEALLAAVGSECLELEDFGAEGFDSARLYQLMDLLLGVQFKPVDHAQ